MLVIQANGVQPLQTILRHFRIKKGWRNPERVSPHENEFYKLKYFCLFYWHSSIKMLKTMFLEFEVLKMNVR